MVVFTGDFLCYIESLLGNNEIYAPVYRADMSTPFLVAWKGREKSGEPVLGSIRTLDPPKILFFPTRNDPLNYERAKKTRILLGVKNCDLQALQLLDEALLKSDFVDPVYREARENTLVVATDCTEAGSTCHCTLQGYEPFPQDNFDVSAAVVGDRLILSSGSPKGDRFLTAMKNELLPQEEPAPLTDALIKRRTRVREEVEELNAQWSLSGREEKIDHQARDALDSCIECGGCNFICPTCYCFLMNDESQGSVHSLVRTWDGCQLKGYGRVAGGSNPRLELFERFNHRYSCKFKYMFRQFAVNGCTGCGRCTDVCPSRIDVRDALRTIRAHEQVKK